MEGLTLTGIVVAAAIVLAVVVAQFIVNSLGAVDPSWIP